MPKVSIIIPAYNSAHFLNDALESVLKQTVQDYEILLIDDGSTDNTKDVIAPYQVKCGDQFVYIYQDNKGLAIARNSALAHARGEFIALLDADDVWLPTRLEQGLKHIESDPNIGLVHANITCISTEGKELSTPQRKQEFLSGKIFDNIFLRKADIACPTVLFRKSCTDKVGNFDPYLARLGCEDRDLWLRIAHKYNFVYVDKVLALYRMSDQSMSRNTEKMLKARLYVVDKYCPKGSPSPLRNQALSSIYRNLGDEALLSRDFLTAKVQYRKAMGFDPLNVWSWINFAKASLNYA